MEKKVCIVTTELMQGLVRYLETKPFGEVHAHIAEILRQCNPTPVGAPPLPAPSEPAAPAVEPET